jgi:hypothetical protein
MDWSSASAAERTCEPCASIQCPNDRNPIFFNGSLDEKETRRYGGTAI